MLTKTKLKKYLLYGIKWQGGSPIMALVIILLPIDNVWIKTIIANIIGAFIFYPVDNWIFNKNKDDNYESKK